MSIGGGRCPRAQRLPEPFQLAVREVGPNLEALDAVVEENARPLMDGLATNFANFVTRQGARRCKSTKNS